MNIVNLINVAFIWVLPILLSWYSLRKMNEEKRREILKRTKTPLFTFSIVPIFIGLLLFLTGSVWVLGLRELKHFGIALMFLGCFMIWVIDLFKKEKGVIKNLSMIVVGIFLVIAYILLFVIG